MNTKLTNQTEKVTIKTLDIYSPTIDTHGNIVKEYNDDFEVDNYLHFPIILNANKSQWKQANRYLLYRLKIDQDINPQTLDIIAIDLRDFKRFCDNESIDYSNAPRKILRPNWLYRKYLIDQLNLQKLSPNTLKRKLSSVTGFYQWLIDYEKIKFKFKLWNSHETFISYKDEYGFAQNKKVIKKDITTIPNASNPTLNDMVIIDGGKLSPLKQSDQIQLFKALRNIRNIEMELLFLIAITTGARIQTACTMRLHQFEKVATEKESEIRIKIGFGTNCDTKYSRQNSLFMPKWLYEKIQTYINSQRAKNKYKESKHIFDDEKLQYVFLSNRGAPFYISKDDTYRKLYSKPYNGNTIRKFISTTLKKELKKDGNTINFSFHDLRATYGMNFIDFHSSSDDKSNSVTKVLVKLKERMGHSRLETTEQYLNFRSKYRLTENAQNDYENFMRSLLEN
ncbi:tyrosine-type recombinase/integrase [Aliarcobacter skirrowii]|uniref:tyrosine-type recombinase/integrase n=1 Tax=Aliarcobacter skirrowii TaxID=28200 RepID=UPI0029B8E4AA|nr:tyrosine-type recombinase/integrase [Aliarcobacter skirrowii]MDX4049126.1 tyrosine-type recombinase/integrase [Aliarcobacter skirrowii]